MREKQVVGVPKSVHKMVEKGRIVNIQEQEEENELKVIGHGVHEITSIEDNVDKEKQAHHN